MRDRTNVSEQLRTWKETHVAIWMHYADIYLENRGKPEIFTSGKSLRSFARWG